MHALFVYMQLYDLPCKTVHNGSLCPYTVSLKQLETWIPWNLALEPRGPVFIPGSLGTWPWNPEVL